MQRVVPLLLLLASVCSGQFLLSLRGLARPPLPLAELAAPAAPAQHAKDDVSFPAALDYKQQVEQRNQQCYQQCATEFPNAEGSVKACERGCRLFALSEATKPKHDADQHRDKCNKDCQTAYPVLVEQHSCQSGCRLQKPKQQDEDGAPVVMSVMRRFSFDSSNGQEVRRSQSSVLVRDGDGFKVIQGPTITFSKHDGSSGGDGGAPPAGLDAVMARMRDAVHHMLSRISGPQPDETPQKDAEPRHANQQSPSAHTVELVGVGPAVAHSGWRRVWRCSPHHALLAALLIGTAVVLYAVYCLLCVVMRARRRRETLLQNMEEAQAEELPPKYCVVEEVPVKTGEPADVPPAYSAVAAESEIPPKLQV